MGCTVQSLLETLETTQISSLSLINLNIMDYHLEFLVEFLRKNGQIQELSLPWNRIGSKGLLKLIDFLKE